MKKLLYALGVLLCISLFSACGNGGEPETPQDDYIAEVDALPIEELPVPPRADIWEVPGRTNGMLVTVNGREVTVTLDGGDAESISIVVLQDDENIASAEIVYIEQVVYSSPFSYTFVLGDNVPAGRYALIVGGAGNWTSLRSNFEIE